MSEPKLIPQSFEPARPPGRWWRCGGALWLSCPGCGTVGQLDEGELDAGGNLASAGCPTRTCSFEEAMRLDGYREPVLT